MKRILSLLLLTIVAVPAIYAVKPETAQFNVATYNMRLLINSDSVRGNGWQRRCPVISDLVKFHDFDIFGTQECFRSQLDQLLDRLDNYACIGVGRNDGVKAGEHSAIFYRTDMFELLDHGDFWLSETPDRPGKGWDAAEPRICSWGKFRHIGTGRVFMFFNLHMDHKGVQARVESARLILKKIDELSDGVTTFLSGDFNVDQTHDSYAEIVATGTLRDSHDVSDFVYATNGTFNSFTSDGFTESRLDHIFVTTDVKVTKYGILTDTYRTAEESEDAETRDAPVEMKMKKYRSRVPSDHFPVRITVQLTE